MAKQRDPKYRLHRQSGQAVVTLRDPATGRRRDVLLGEHDTPASHAEYARVVQEWKDTGRVLDATPRPDALTPPDKSVARLLLDYIAAEQKRYGVQPEDRQPSNIVSIKVALRRCRRVAGGMDARAFGPRALTEVRDAMVAEGLARQHVNRQVRQIVRAFSWGDSQERIPAAKVDAMKHLRPLQRGEQGTTDKPRIKPAPVAHVDAALPYLSPQIAVMVALMRYTGMRPNEVVQLRLADIDMSAKTWTYTPRKHKTQHHDIERFIPMGPKAQQSVAPFLVGRKLTAAMFSPIEADRWMRDKRRATRQTPESCGNTPGSNRVAFPRRKPGEFYTVGAVCRAVQRACKNAGVAAPAAERIETAAARQAVTAQTPLTDRVQAWVGRLNAAWFEVQFYEESNTGALAEGRARCIAPRREPWRRYRRPGLVGLDALRQNELLRDVAGIDAMLEILDDLMALPTESRPLLPIQAQQLAWLLGESAERFTADDLTEADREGRFYPDERPWATHADRLIGEARKRAPGAPVPLGPAARAACCKVTLRQQRACSVVPGVDEDLDRRLVAMLPSPADLERLVRYETHADRTLSRALETLARLRGVPVQTVLARVSVRHADGSGYELSREESVWGHARAAGILGWDTTQRMEAYPRATDTLMMTLSKKLAS